MDKNYNANLDEDLEVVGSECEDEDIEDEIDVCEEDDFFDDDNDEEDEEDQIKAKLKKLKSKMDRFAHCSLVIGFFGVLSIICGVIIANKSNDPKDYFGTYYGVNDFNYYTYYISEEESYCTLSNGTDMAIEKTNLEKSLHTFVKSTIKAILYFLVLIVILGMLGIPITSFIAVLC